MHTCTYVRMSSGVTHRYSMHVATHEYHYLVMSLVFAVIERDYRFPQSKGQRCKV